MGNSGYYFRRKQNRACYWEVTWFSFVRHDRDGFYQMFVHGIEADKPLVLMLKQDEPGRALREAVQKKCPNLPSSFILLHQGRKVITAIFTFTCIPTVFQRVMY